MGVVKRVGKTGVFYDVNFSYKENGITMRYFKRGFKTKKDALNHMALVKAHLLENGTIEKECTKTFKQVYNEFLEVGTSKYQANTVYNTKRYHKQYKELDRYKITEINYYLLQRFFNKRKDQGIETNKNIKKSMNRVFKYAYEVGYIKENPLNRVTVSGKENHMKHNEIIEYSDFIRLTDALEEKGTFNYYAYSIAIKISYYTGLRVSEVLALEKGDVNLEDDTIDINKKLVYKGLKKKDYYVTHDMKSKSSKRVIPIASVLKDDLIEWFNINPYSKVVCDKDNYYINPGSLSNIVKRVAKELDIDFYFHMLRHSFATNLVMGGVDLKTTQELMRHSNINTTLSIYTHVQEKQEKQALDMVFNKKCDKSVTNDKTTNLAN